MAVYLGDNIAYEGTDQECKDFLIGKCRVIAGTDQMLYMDLFQQVTEEGVLNYKHFSYQIKS